MFYGLNTMLIRNKCTFNLITAWEGDQEEVYWIYQGSPERKQRTESHKKVKERERSQPEELDRDGN